jgi:hypothetical protein
VVPRDRFSGRQHENEWLAVLAGLAADRKRAQSMGLTARRRAEAMYSLAPLDSRESCAML